MQNNAEIDGKFLGSITEDFIKVAERLKDASYQIRKRKFSDQPIFAISKVEIPIGTLLIGPFEEGNSWHYYASFLQEFEQRNLINKQELFVQTYKNPDEFCCLFVVDQQFTNFLYIPYPEET